jgi:hypothetical protein
MSMKTKQLGYDHAREASQDCQPDPGAGGRVPLMALVGQFRLDYGAQGPQRLVRLVDVCLHDSTPLLDDSWCILTAGMQALHLLEGDRISFEARVTLHATPTQRRVGVSPCLQDRIVTLD